MEAFPLYWPEGVPRTKNPEGSRFKTGFGAARNYLFGERDVFERITQARQAALLEVA
jgi:hypothetical protein